MANLATHLVDQLDSGWELDPLSRDLLVSACALHEIGLSVDFKRAPQHAAYLVNNLDLPGFTPAQKKLIATLLLNQTNAIDLSSLHQQNAVPRALPNICVACYGWRFCLPAAGATISCQPFNLPPTTKN